MVTQYKLYINDFALEGNERARLFKNDRCVALNDGATDSNDWERNLSTPVLEQDYSSVWDRYFEHNPRVDKAGDKKILRVFGSEFSKCYFQAVFNNEANVLNRKDYCEIDLTADNDGPLKINDAQLEERCKQLVSLLGNRIGNIEPVRMRVVIESVNFQSAKSFAESLSSKVNTEGLFEIEFSGEAPDAPCDLKVAIVDRDYNKKLDDVQVYFVADMEAKVNNVIEIDGKRWVFNDLDSLLNTVKLYVESQLIAPRFAELCREFETRVGGGLDINDRIALIRLSRVFPFAIAFVPEEIVVEERFKVIEYNNAANDGDAPRLERINADLKDSENISKDAVAYYYTTEALDDLSFQFSPANYEADWIPTWMTNCFFWCDRIRGGGEILQASRNYVARVNNHKLTTSMAIELNDEALQKDFRVCPDYKHLKIDIRANASYYRILTIVATNKYEPSIEPIDVEKIKVEVCEGDASLLNVTKDDHFISFRPTGKCDCSVRVSIDGGKCEPVVFFVSAFEQASKLKCEIRLGNGSNRKAVRLAKDGNGALHFNCFRYEEIQVRAQLEGPSYPLWNSNVGIDGLDVNGKDGEFVFRYGSAGHKEFSLYAVDSSVSPVKISVSVKADHAKKFFVLMVLGTLLAFYLGLTVYGLDGWPLAVYSFPIGLYGLYRILGCLKFRKMMLAFLIWDFFLLMQALWEELA